MAQMCLRTLIFSHEPSAIFIFPKFFVDFFASIRIFKHAYHLHKKCKKKKKKKKENGSGNPKPYGDFRRLLVRHV